MFKFLLLATCAFTLTFAGKISTGADFEDSKQSAGEIYQSISFADEKEDHKNAIDGTQAARQAAYTAQTTLAQAAAGAAATAQAALQGKHTLVQILQRDVQKASRTLASEISQLEQIEKAAYEALQTARQTQQQLSAINVAFNVVQSAVDNAQRAAKDFTAELSAQQATVGAAKQKLAILNQRLVSAQGDLEATQVAVQNTQDLSKSAIVVQQHGGVENDVGFHHGDGGHGY